MPAECTIELNRICEYLAEGERSLTLHRVCDRLHDLVDADERTSALALVLAACSYRSENPGEDSPFKCGPYVPLFTAPLCEGDSEPWPWKLDEAPDRAVDVWRSHARDEGLHPMIRARMADLLWVRGESESSQPWHRIAVETHLKAAVSDAGDMERVDGLVRALAITKESNQRDLQPAVLDALCAMAEVALSDEQGPYGVVIRSLEALCEGGRECTDLIERALDAYGSVHWKSVSLNRLAASRATGEERRAYESAQIAATEAAADNTTGLLRFKLLEEAVHIAERLGHADEAERLRIILEQVDTTGDTHTIRAEAPIDQAKLDHEIERIVGDDDLASAFRRLSEHLPSGDTEHNRAVLGQLRSGAASASLFTETAIGPYNSASTTSPGTQARDEAELGRYEARCIEVFAVCVGLPAIKANAVRYQSTRDEIADIFESEFIERELAERIARAFERCVNDDCISAVSVLVLCIEPIIREIAHRLGIAVTKSVPARAATTSELRPLGALLSDLEGHIGTSWTRYYQAALSNPDALNFRNAATHGIVAEFTQEQFAVLFHIVCTLRMRLRVIERSPGEQGDSSESSTE